MRAYLTMMAIRLVELRRVLKDTGSLYLHCDPTASHYLKLLMDTIFGPQGFRNEVIWKRTAAHSSSKRYGPIHQVILFYTKSDKYVWNKLFSAYDESYIENFYRNTDEHGRRYQLVDLSAPGDRKGTRAHYEWHGRFPPAGRHWAFTQDVMERFETEGNIIYSKQGTPRLKQFLDEMPGLVQQDLWTDINAISSQASERLGYETQKPIALLERVIQASSNEGDIVLDPFCGCGTAIVAAQRLNRKWIGIDITYLAIGLMEWRLKNMTPPPAFKVIGAPVDLASATDLARRNPYQFQWWAVSLAGGQPFGGKKKGADTGIDGYLYYMDYADGKVQIRKAIVSVKGGGVHVNMVRDLGHVIDREKADIGVFITLEPPTKPMGEEAALKGFYRSANGQDYPRLQILTIEQLLAAKGADIPARIAPITPALPAKKRQGKSARLL